MKGQLTLNGGLWRRAVIALAAITAVALTFGMAASANAKELGTTTLKPNAKTFGTLAGIGISVAPTTPAKAGKDGIAFPITKADLSPKLTGTIDHRGGLKFSGHGKTLAVKNFVIKIGKKSHLFAYAGKTKVKLLKLDLSKAKIRNGGKTVGGVKASLSGAGAQALSDTFGVHIAKGTPIGRAQVAFK